MRPFPGSIEKCNRKYVLKSWQRTWLRNVYPNNTDKDISRAMGISCTVMRNIAKEMNLERPKRGTVSIATKLSVKDYKLLCALARFNKKSKYQYIQEIVLRQIKFDINRLS